MMGGDGGIDWIGGALMMVLFWGGLVVLVAFVARGFGGRPSGDSGPEHRRPAPRQILSERFARGEISEEEFEQRTRVLERQSK
jgi:putative membrane protein